MLLVFLLYIHIVQLISTETGLSQCRITQARVAVARSRDFTMVIAYQFHFPVEIICSVRGRDHFPKGLDFFHAIVIIQSPPFQCIGSGATPETNSSTSSAISRYGDYLEGVYSRSSVLSDGKFPPTPSKTYINLALVRRSDEVRDLEELRKHTLHGKVSDILKGKRDIEFNDILKPLENNKPDGTKEDKPVLLVFIEGPPGLGKSTLAWELCRRWDRKQYDLAVLLRLRESEVQQIESIVDLFPCFDKDLQKSAVKDVLDRKGKGVLFVLDGYDELPVSLRRKGLLLKLIKGEVFPKCSVLVTSRPSATKDLYTTCYPQIQRHIEILGFTQECVESYASSIFSTEPEVLKDFLSYISASENPAINSLMYIPLNAAIIVHLFKTSKRKGCPIPKTLTQVYTQLCLTLLQRHLDNIDPLNAPTMNHFSSLPGNYYTDFNRLSKLAFEQFEQNRIVFYSDDIPQESNFVHFGLLDSVPPLHGGGGVSYNFLHLTVQEFLAAYHITQLSDGIDVFKRHSEDRRWEVVWRFVSGLTGFQFFKDNVQCGAFGVELTQILNDMPFAIRIDKIYNSFVIPMYDPSSDPCPIAVSYLFLHCLFEGQVTWFDYPSAFGRNAVYCQAVFPPLDRYVAGYCIANSSSTTSWLVDIEGGSDESFVWGLKSRHSDNGIIRHLSLDFVYPFLLPSYPVSMLRGIQSLTVNFLAYRPGDEVTQSLIQVVPLLENLNSLSFTMQLTTSRVALDLLDVVSHSNTTTLILANHYTTEDPEFLTSLHNLVNPSSSNLKNLTLDLGLTEKYLKALCNIVFGQTSLNQLTLCIGFFYEESLNLLQADTSLTHVQFRGNMQNPFQAFSNILRKNKTIQVLRWFCDIGYYYTIPPDHMEAFQEALSVNTTLKEFVVIMRRDEPLLDCSLLASNPRVTLSYV